MLIAFLTVETNENGRNSSRPCETLLTQGIVVLQHKGSGAWNWKSLWREVSHQCWLIFNESAKTKIHGNECRITRNVESPWTILRFLIRISSFWLRKAAWLRWATFLLITEHQKKKNAEPASTMNHKYFFHTQHKTLHRGNCVKIKSRLEWLFGSLKRVFERINIYFI